MLQKRSYMTVFDNSGIKEVYCYHKNTKRNAQVGDLIWAVTSKIKAGINCKYKKGTPVRALICSTKSRVKRGSTWIFGSDNGVILLDSKGTKPLGSRILKEVFKETNRSGKYGDIMKLVTQ